MAEMINGRTPEKIKRNLSHLVRCEICPQNHEYGCDYENRTKECQTVIDSLALIERLESERDAAINDIPRACGYCKHYSDPPKIEETELGTKVSYCEKECHHISGVNTGWEWRGLKPPEVEG